MLLQYNTMKKLAFFTVLALVAGMMFFVACQPEEEVAPSNSRNSGGSASVEKGLNAKTPTTEGTDEGECTALSSGLTFVEVPYALQNPDAADYDGELYCEVRRFDSEISEESIDVFLKSDTLGNFVELAFSENYVEARGGIDNLSEIIGSFEEEDAAACMKSCQDLPKGGGRGWCRFGCVVEAAPDIHIHLF